MPQIQTKYDFVTSLKLWQEIDASDYEGEWFQAVVVLRNDQYIRVHFVGWDKKFHENIAMEEVHCRIRSRRRDSKTGPGGPQTITEVKALFRCGRCSAHRGSMKFTRDQPAGARKT